MIITWLHMMSSWLCIINWRFIKDICSSWPLKCANLKINLTQVSCGKYIRRKIFHIHWEGVFPSWKSPCILIKTKRNWKWEIPRTVLEKCNLHSSSYKNRKIKVKLSWVRTRRKKRAFFVPFIFSEGNFINICVLSQCIAYWIHCQNIYTFTYQKTFLHTPFCLFLKSSKDFSISLNVG